MGLVQKTATPETTGEVSKSDALLEKTICLKFSSGFTFSIRVSAKEMVVEAKLREKTMFYLDQIPIEFIRDLKNLLREF